MPAFTRVVVVDGAAIGSIAVRHGFVLESQDPIDVIMVRPAAARGIPLLAAGTRPCATTLESCLQ